jgi:hypothetical protein
MLIKLSFILTAELYFNYRSKNQTNVETTMSLEDNLSSIKMVYPVN